MARLPRLDLPGIPQHIVQRGNNRLPCFLNDGDRLGFLQGLQDALMATGVQLHAYVLINNHVHPLATPAAAGDIGRLMQRFGRQYVGLFNTRHRRTGTLLGGRYKSCLVDSDRHVLTCQRYIELNPVSALITDDAATWRWSSCTAHPAQRNRSMLTPHPAWLALDSDPVMRARRWRDMLDEAVTEEDLTAVREYLQQQRAWGRDDFRAIVEAKTRRFAGVRPAH